MWHIFESKATLKELRRAPKELLESYEAWKNVVLLSGPSGLRNINGYRDHALSGEWDGARSSSLNRQWRVIYLVQSEEIQVMVLRVTAHDYRRKK